MHKKRSTQRSMPPQKKGHCGKHAAPHAARIKAAIRKSSNQKQQARSPLYTTLRLQNQLFYLR